MAQIIENWSELRGRIEDVTVLEGDAVDLDLLVDAVEPVPGFANLLAETRGRSIRVRLPLEGAEMPRPGDDLRVRVRKAAPDRYFGRLAAGEG